MTASFLDTNLYKYTAYTCTVQFQPRTHLMSSFSEAGQLQATAGSSSCIDCNAGRYRSSTGGNSGSASSGQCIVCETGQYQAATGASSCTTCSSGSYRASEAGTNANQCITW